MATVGQYLATVGQCLTISCSLLALAGHHPWFCVSFSSSFSQIVCCQKAQYSLCPSKLYQSQHWIIIHLIFIYNHCLCEWNQWTVCINWSLCHYHQLYNYCICSIYIPGFHLTYSQMNCLIQIFPQISQQMWILASCRRPLWTLLPCASKNAPSSLFDRFRWQTQPLANVISNYNTSLIEHPIQLHITK